MKKECSSIVCSNCAVYLAEECYKKHWYFHVVRDPLVWGMKFLAFCNRINVKKHVVRKTHCKGCIRFMKTELEVKSPTFRIMNQFIAPRFASIRNGMLTPEQFAQAKQLANDAMKDE